MRAYVKDGGNLLNLTKVNIRTTANMKITQHGNELVFAGSLSAWQTIVDPYELILENGKTYTISCNKYYTYGKIGVRMALRIHNRDDNAQVSSNDGWGGAIKFTVDNTKFRYFVLIQGGPTAGEFNETLSWMLNEGSTALPYKAFSDCRKIKVIDETRHKDTTISEAFTTRQTANGLTVVEPSSAIVEMIKGKTVKSINLIPTYKASSRTHRGITFTQNEDGAIVINGQNDGTGNSRLTLLENFSLKQGTYSSITKGNIYLVLNDDTDGVVADWISGTAKTVSKNYDNLDVWLQVKKGDTTVYDNYVIYPMLNEGSTALQYTPYFSGLKHANFKTIKSIGKQLLRKNLYRFSSGTQYGVALTVNDDGSITAKGTATSRVVLTLGNYTKDMLQAGTYYISGSVTQQHYLDFQLATPSYIRYDHCVDHCLHHELHYFQVPQSFH